jgi:UDP-N-acetylmuramate--alanine ligase
VTDVASTSPDQGALWALRPGDRVHLVGIGGIGLSGIARVLLQRGYVVSGSDLQMSPLTQALLRLGATVQQGHDAQNVREADLVIASSAIPAQNPEIREARRAGLPVINRGQMLRWLTEGQYAIAVAGTHGKTTTSAMIALLLDSAGLDPTILVGGIIPELESNARAGKGRYFVVEADEYDRAFLNLSPDVAVVTNIEMDHPDCYADLGEMSAAFGDFLAGMHVGGLVVACGDDPRVRQVVLSVDRARVVTYGLGPDTVWRAENLEANARGDQDFVVMQNEAERGNFGLSIPGRHNVSNALAAIAVADHLGLDLTRVRDVLRRFRGVERRFQTKGEVDGITVLDDYAHHPSEIRATLAAARQRYPGRQICVVFQPHTYSRTKALLAEFASAFHDADDVVVTDIYAAREKDDLGISARDLVARMAHPSASHVSDLAQAAVWASNHLRPGGLLITMGAGDVWQVGERVLAMLQKREQEMGEHK